MDMPEVKAFNAELSGLYENRPPISKAKMSAITRGAIKAIKFYKHVVHSVEKFISKCKPEYKVPGLYVIDSIVRQSRHQFGAEKDVFAPRFAKNMQQTGANLFRCPPEDKRNIIRVLNLWQKNNVFGPEVIQPLLDMADPNHPIHQEMQLNISTNGNLSLPTASDSKTSPGGHLNTPHQHTPNDVNMQDTSGGSSKLSKRLLSMDFEYESEQDEGAAGSCSPLAPPPVPAPYQQPQQQQQPSSGAAALLANVLAPGVQAADALGSILANPEILRQLQSIQQQMQMMAGMQNMGVPMPNSTMMVPEMRPPEQPIMNSISKVNKDESPAGGSDIEFVNSGPEVIEIPDTRDSRSPSPARRSRRKRSSSPRRRDRDRDRDRERDRDRDRERDREKEREREKEKEREKERAKKGLPPMKKDNLSVCSTTLWVGHLSKQVSEQELSDLFGEIGSVASIDVVAPRGCAFVVMERRRDAHKALTKLHKHTLHNKDMTLAWAPGKGVKGRDWRDYWELDDGVTYIPFQALRKAMDSGTLDLALLEEGGHIDDETAPPWLPPRVSLHIRPDMPPGMPPPGMMMPPGMPPGMPPHGMPPGVVGMPMMPPGFPPGFMPPHMLPPHLIPTPQQIPQATPSPVVQPEPTDGAVDMEVDEAHESQTNETPPMMVPNMMSIPPPNFNIPPPPFSVTKQQKSESDETAQSQSEAKEEEPRDKRERESDRREKEGEKRDRDGEKRERERDRRDRDRRDDRDSERRDERDFDRRDRDEKGHDRRDREDRRGTDRRDRRDRDREDRPERDRGRDRGRRDRDNRGDGRDNRGDGRDNRMDGRDNRGDGRDNRGDGRDNRGDSREIRGDSREIRGDSREIRGDNREIRGDSREIRGDSREIRGDSREGRWRDTNRDRSPVRSQSERSSLQERLWEMANGKKQENERESANSESEARESEPKPTSLLGPGPANASGIPSLLGNPPPSLLGPPPNFSPPREVNDQPQMNNSFVPVNTPADINIPKLMAPNINFNLLTGKPNMLPAFRPNLAIGPRPNFGPGAPGPNLGPGGSGSNHGPGPNLGPGGPGPNLGPGGPNLGPGGPGPNGGPGPGPMPPFMSPAFRPDLRNRGMRGQPMRPGWLDGPPPFGPRFNGMPMPPFRPPFDMRFDRPPFPRPFDGPLPFNGPPPFNGLPFEDGGNRFDGPPNEASDRPFDRFDGRGPRDFNRNGNRRGLDEQNDNERRWDRGNRGRNNREWNNRDGPPRRNDYRDNNFDDQNRGHQNNQEELPEANFEMKQDEENQDLNEKKPREKRTSRWGHFPPEDTPTQPEQDSADIGDEKKVEEDTQRVVDSTKESSESIPEKNEDSAPFTMNNGENEMFQEQCENQLDRNISLKEQEDIFTKIDHVLSKDPGRGANKEGVSRIDFGALSDSFVNSGGGGGNLYSPTAVSETSESKQSAEPSSSPSLNQSSDLPNAESASESMTGCVTE